MKKICYVVTLSSTLRAFFFSQLSYLVQYGYDVTVICKDNIQIAEKLEKKGIHFINIDFPRGISVNKSVTSIIDLIKVFKKNKYDFIQYSTPNAALYAAFAAQITGSRIRNYHCMGFRYLGFSGFKRKLFKTIEKITCSMSTNIECVSESNLQWGISEKLFSKKKAVVVYHGSTGGIDLNRFNHALYNEYRTKHREEIGYVESDFVIGFVGRITKDKGIVELLHAFSSISLEDYNVKLALIGSIENENSDIPESLLSAARANSNIQFLGRKDAIEEYYPMLDVLVLPSYREGFGNVVIEAEAMGVPVVVTEIPGPLDTMIPNKTGLCCKVQDELDLKNKLEILIKDEELRRVFGEKAHEYVVNYFDSNKLNEQILKKKRVAIEAILRKTMKPLVSIIVPVYNNEKYIERCIKSILSQSYKNIELILVDDCSSDHSPDICIEFEKNDSRVRTYMKVNEGAGYARNLGIEKSSGEYIMFIDSDDYLLPGCISRMVSIAEYEKCGLVKVKHISGSEDDFIIRNRTDKPYKKMTSAEAFETREVNISIWGKLYRRDVIGNIRYPKVTTHDDEYMTYRLIYAAEEIVVLDEVYYYYYNNPQSIMHRKRKKQPLYFMAAFNERIDFFEKSGEMRLAEISHKEYAIRLMLACCSRDNYESCDLSFKELFSIFKIEYQLGKKTAVILKEKYSLMIFNMFPQIMSHIYRRLRKG